MVSSAIPHKERGVGFVLAADEVNAGFGDVALQPLIEPTRLGAKWARQPDV
jgi:hypothetical protein